MKFRFKVLAVVIYVLAVLALMALVTAASAHDFWINNRDYKGTDGIHCCGETDCPEIAADRIKITPRGLILLDYDNELVPWAEVTPSEDGKTYRCKRTDGTRRCFFSSPGGV